MTDKPKAPYAPIQNVLDVLHRMRDRGLPEKLDTSALQAIGVPEGNAARTLAALKFLALVEDDERLSPLFEQLGKAATGEYPSILEGILRSAYARVFQIVEPSQDGEIAINDAFRQYEPVAQRTRMVTLFLGLCTEAGILAPGAVRAPVKRISRPVGKTKASPKTSGTPSVPSPPVRDRAYSIIKTGESKTIRLHSGGELTLHASVSFFQLPREDRNFVFELLDKLTEYETVLMIEAPKQRQPVFGVSDETLERLTDVSLSTADLVDGDEDDDDDDA